MPRIWVTLAPPGRKTRGNRCVHYSERVASFASTTHCVCVFVCGIESSTKPTSHKVPQHDTIQLNVCTDKPHSNSNNLVFVRLTHIGIMVFRVIHYLSSFAAPPHRAVAIRLQQGDRRRCRADRREPAEAARPRSVLVSAHHGRLARVHCLRPQPAGGADAGPVSVERVTDECVCVCVFQEVRLN